jgi:hypothetical protein
VLVPGVKGWDEYERNRKLWDPIQQCVSLDAEFYEGVEVKLFPKEWLEKAAERARQLDNFARRAKAIGIDPAEGGDNTALCAVDEYGVIELVSMKTPDTNAAFWQAMSFIRKHGVDGKRVVWDRGGGGKEHADRMRAQGIKCRTVGFGEPIHLDPKRGKVQMEARLGTVEEHYSFKNRRAQLYGELRQLIDPSSQGIGQVGLGGYGLPSQEGVCAELHRQLSVIPLWRDEEGRLYLPPKQRKPTDRGTVDKVTLNSLLGCSPDEADAVCLAVHALIHRGDRNVASAA